MAHLILSAFSERPGIRFEPSSDGAALAIALVCKLSVEVDVQALVESVGSDTEQLLGILLQKREIKSELIIERAAALGPSILPRLTGALDEDEFDWGAIRAASTIERMARLYPGQCASAAPALIEAINDDAGDFLCEACSDALGAIGPDAVALIAQRLRDDDKSRQIYLTGTLGDIPTERSAQAILEWLAEGEPVDEIHVSALTRIGSASAIDSLISYNLESDYLFAESLLVLCEVNDIVRPEMVQWRETVREEQERRLLFQQEMAQFNKKYYETNTLREETRPPQPSVAPRQKTTVSKAEKRKRAKHRMANIKKKKKK